ncbi:hypothetical protein J6590_104658 [Homalodisca vitripennis]|nr:hypothetical protein J6590_104658 [Homalodisca vitripennis]
MQFLPCVRWHYDDACSSYHMYGSAPKTHEVPTMCTLELRGFRQCLLCDASTMTTHAVPTCLTCVRWHYEDSYSAYHVYAGTMTTHAVPTMCTLALRGLMQCLPCARWHYDDSCSAYRVYASTTRTRVVPTDSYSAYYVYAGSMTTHAVPTVCTLALQDSCSAYHVYAKALNSLTVKLSILSRSMRMYGEIFSHVNLEEKDAGSVPAYPVKPGREKHSLMSRPLTQAAAPTLTIIFNSRLDHDPRFNYFVIVVVSDVTLL